MPMFSHAVRVSVVLWGACLNAQAAKPACDATAPATVAVAVVNSATVSSFIKQQRKEVLTLAGFSGAGYEDPAAMLAHDGRVLAGGSGLRQDACAQAETQHQGEGQPRNGRDGPDGTGWAPGNVLLEWTGPHHQQSTCSRCDVLPPNSHSADRRSERHERAIGQKPKKTSRRKQAEEQAEVQPLCVPAEAAPWTPQRGGSASADRKPAA